MEMSDEKFEQIVKKVLKLITTREPQKHAEMAKEHRGI